MIDVDREKSQLEINYNTARCFFGDAVKYLREEKNITQQELEWFSGVQQNVISQIESGKQNFKIEHIVRIALAFNMNLSTFIEVCFTVGR